MGITAKLMADRKAKRECIDCGRPAEEDDQDRPKARVRCQKCRGKIAESRRKKLRNGLCSMCGTAPHRPRRTTCGDCAKIAQSSHKKFLLNKRKRACNPTEPVVESQVGGGSAKDSEGLRRDGQGQTA